MIRIAVCEDNLDELQVQKEMIRSIMLKLSKNIKIFGFQSGEELLFEIDISGDMNIVFLDVEMIEVQPYAFLDKPVSEEKLMQILRRVFETRLNLSDGYIFSYHKKQYNIPLAQIRLFQSDKRIIWVDTIHKSSLTIEYLFYGKLEEVEKQVNETDVKFIRIRKSFLINSQYIIEFSADRVVLDNGLVVEISKKYRKNVTKQYMSVLRGKGWE